MMAPSRCRRNFADVASGSFVRATRRSSEAWSRRFRNRLLLNRCILVVFRQRAGRPVPLQRARERRLPARPALLKKSVSWNLLSWCWEESHFWACLSGSRTTGSLLLRIDRRVSISLAGKGVLPMFGSLRWQVREWWWWFVGSSTLICCQRCQVAVSQDWWRRLHPSRSGFEESASVRQSPLAKRPAGRTSW